MSCKSNIVLIVSFQASYMILDDDDHPALHLDDTDQDTSHNSSVPSFPRPAAREYILRTVVPRPAPYSKQLPQRMYCSIEEDEFRLAGAYASDSVFQWYINHLVILCFSYLFFIHKLSFDGFFTEKTKSLVGFFDLVDKSNTGRFGFTDIVSDWKQF